MATGGSIETVTLAGRSFAVAADADVERELGGFTNEVQANGDGTARLIKLRVPWTLGGLTLAIDDDAGDPEFLQGLSDRNDFYPIAVTYPSGAVYQGTGAVTDNIPTSSQSTTAAIKLMGPQKLTKQA